MYTEKDIRDFEKLISSLRDYKQDKFYEEHIRLMNDLYVDPIQGNGLLKRCLQDRSTVLVGRKGTGKSTVLMRMRNELENSTYIIPTYMNIRTISAGRLEYGISSTKPERFNLDPLQREFMIGLITELVKEIESRHEYHKECIEKLISIKNVLIEDKPTSKKEVIESYRDTVHGKSKVENIKIIFAQIKAILKGMGYNRLFIVLDDYSEMSLSDSEKFYKLILSPLSDDSEEYIKFKLSAYPGRLELGQLNLKKVDICCLDHNNLFDDSDPNRSIDIMAVFYINRILTKRSEIFTSRGFAYYFDTKNESEEDYCKLLFSITGNTVGHLGEILEYAKEVSLKYGRPINRSDLKGASKMFYKEEIGTFFQKKKSVLVSYKDRIKHFQFEELLNNIIFRAKSIKDEITIDRSREDIYYENSNNPYCSHFYVDAVYEEFLSTLESNFFISKVKESRSSNGNKIIIYSLNYGLATAEEIRWGRPEGVRYSGYFTQSIFNYNATIEEFLDSVKMGKCFRCGALYQTAELEYLKKGNNTCIVCYNSCGVSKISLSDLYREKIEKVNNT